MSAQGERRLMRIAGPLLVVWIAVVIVWIGIRKSRNPAGARGRPAPTAPPARGELPVLWDLPRFSFVDQHGSTVTDQSLRGRVLIVDFIFTRCTTACPLITAKMNLLRRAIVRPDVRFVSVSVDPDHDTPAALASYAERWTKDPRWLLLSTTPSGLADLTGKMKVALAKGDDEENPIVHGSQFFLVDGSGRVRGVFGSGDDEALGRLVAEVASLELTAASAPGPAEAADHARSGMLLYQSLGCAGCHDDARVAPLLGGALGRTVSLAEGGTVTADRAYLRRAIVEPAAELTAGFAVPMPSYRGRVSDAELDSLIDYVASLPAPASAASAASAANAPGEPVTDPVCGMKVVASEPAPHLEHDGKTYFFCSELCRDRFVKEPAKYLERP